MEKSELEFHHNKMDQLMIQYSQPYQFERLNNSNINLKEKELINIISYQLHR